jgi:hypothetical protein
MGDEEFRAAIIAFLHSWIRLEWLAEHGEEGFERMFNIAVNGNIGSMFRTFHAEHGRYPEYEELCPPGGPIRYQHSRHLSLASERRNPRAIIPIRGPRMMRSRKTIDEDRL